MKIHLYLNDFRPTQNQETGMEKAIAGLAGGMAANGAEVVVLCESDADHSIRTPQGYDIRAFCNPRKRKTLGMADGLRQYAKTELGPDSLVVLNAIFHPSVARFSKLLRKLGVPYIVAPHDPYHPTIFLKNAKIKWPYWYLMERPMLRNALAVQVLDARHGEYLHKLGVKTPVIEVINGHNPADVLPVEQLQFRLEGPPRLLYLGRIESLNKGLDILVDAFNEVANDSDAELTLQGPDIGDLAGLKAQAAGMKNGNRVKFLPPDFKTSPALLASRYDIFMLCSRFEGFSLATMEAMLAARVVVVSDIAGLAPHVRACGGGVVVDATIASVRDGVRSLLARRADWKTIGMAGRDYALSRFRWERIGAEAMAAYQKLLADRKK